MVTSNAADLANQPSPPTPPHPHPPPAHLRRTTTGLCMSGMVRADRSVSDGTEMHSVFSRPMISFRPCRQCQAPCAAREVNGGVEGRGDEGFP